MCFNSCTNRQQQWDVIGAINVNYKFIHHLIRHAGDMFGNQVNHTHPDSCPSVPLSDCAS